MATTAATATEEELGELVLRTVKSFGGLIRRLCVAAGHEEEYDDARATVILALWKLALQYDPSRNDNFEASSYLRVRGEVLDHLRRLRLRGRKSRNEYEYKVFPIHEDTLDRFMFHRRREPFRDGFLGDWRVGMSKRSVLVLEMMFVGDTEQKEIAERLGVCPARAYAIRMKALGFLRGKIEGRQKALASAAS